MTVRKMWAPKEWENDEQATCYGFCTEFPDRVHWTATPVIVTDATGMPDFEPGDRVEARHSPNGVFRVVDVPVQVAGVWYVPVVLDRESDVAHPMLRMPANLTKLPREKTVTLRVTGLEEAVDRFVSKCDRDYLTGIRVERVEDER
jgi:hypothetical protein